MACRCMGGAQRLEMANKHGAIVREAGNCVRTAALEASLADRIRAVRSMTFKSLKKVENELYGGVNKNDKARLIL